MAVKSVSIRIEDEMLKKISYVSEYEGRSLNSHILILIRRSIKEFEEQNGKISLEEPIKPEDNVKPGGRY